MDCCDLTQGTNSNARAERSADDPPQADNGVCPVCLAKGRSVDLITLKALLTATALKRLQPTSYRFCPSRDCHVVYFAGESVFNTDDLRVPVWQKSASSSVPVCYCFEHSEESIRAMMDGNAEKGPVGEIKRLVQEGRCACEVRNPQGSCCLGNVTQVVERILSGKSIHAEAVDEV
jgi:hypothetical protein